MGIIAPEKQNTSRPKVGSKKAMAEAMSYAANQYIASPLTGERVTQWQAVVDRLFKTATYAESDKDATSAAKVIRDSLFGRPAVMKQENRHEIPAIIFAERGDTLEDITEKAARAEEDPEDYDGPMKVGITFEDGTEMVVDAEDDE